jgi:hypothetical protein
MSESTVYAATSSAPPAGLATAFDADGRRRYSGGLLQKAAGSGDSDETPSPTTSRAGSNIGIRSPGSGNLDPALRSPGARSDASDSEVDKSNAAWVENIRVIEALRLFIKEKIESGDFADGEDGESRGDPMETDQDREAQSLYPVLREVQGEA